MVENSSPSTRFKEAMEVRIQSSTFVKKKSLKEIVSENLTYIEEVRRSRRADMSVIAEELGVAYETNINERSMATTFYALRDKKGNKKVDVASPPIGVAPPKPKPTSPITPAPALKNEAAANEHRKSVEPIRLDNPDL